MGGGVQDEFIFDVNRLFLRQVFYAINQQDISLQQLIYNHKVILVRLVNNTLGDHSNVGYCLVFIMFSYMM